MHATQLKAVEEIAADSLEGAERKLAAVNARCGERGQKIAALEAEVVKIDDSIRDAALTGKIEGLSEMTARKAALVDAADALRTIALPALVAEREAAQARVAELQAAARLEAFRAQEPAARKAVHAADEALRLALEAFRVAIVERENSFVQFQYVGDGLARGGAPVASPPTTRAALRVLGCGRMFTPKPGVERIEIPIPSGLPL